MAHAFHLFLTLRDTHSTFIARSPRREKNRVDHRAAKTKRFIVASSSFALNSNPLVFRDLRSGIVRLKIVLGDCWWFFGLRGFYYFRGETGKLLWSLRCNLSLLRWIILNSNFLVFRDLWSSFFGDSVGRLLTTFEAASELYDLMNQMREETVSSVKHRVREFLFFH